MASKVIGLDLTKRDGFNKAITGRVGDKEETYSFRLFNNGVLFDLNQADQIALLGLTPSGYYVDAVCFPQSDGTISVSIPSAFNAEMGYFQRCFVRVVTKTGETLSTQDLIYYSYGNADISAGNAQDYIGRVEVLVEQINEMADQLEEDLTGQFAQLRADLTSATNDLAALETKINNFMNQFDGTPLLFRTTQITTQDWNTVTTSGIYSLNNASGANRPHTNAHWGRLEVITGTTQRYTDDTGQLFIRTATGNPLTWQPWRRFVYSTEVYSKTEVDAKITAINNDASFVKTTGNQSIGGAKTFTGDVVLNGNTNTKALNSTNINSTGYVHAATEVTTKDLKSTGTTNLATVNVNTLNVSQQANLPIYKRTVAYPASEWIKAGNLYLVRQGCFVSFTVAFEVLKAPQWKKLVDLPTGYVYDNAGIKCVGASQSYTAQFAFVYGSGAAMQGLFPGTITAGTVGFQGMYTTNDAFQPADLVTT